MHASIHPSIHPYIHPSIHTYIIHAFLEIRGLNCETIVIKQTNR